MGRILLSLSLSLSEKRKWEGFSPTPSKERLGRSSSLPSPKISEGSFQEREGKSREREGRAFPFFPKSEGRPSTLARNSRLPGSLQECRRLRSTPSRMSWAPCAPRVGRFFLLVLSSQMKWICSFAKVGIALLGSCRTKSLSHQQNKIMRKSVGRTLERKGPCQQEECGGFPFSFLAGGQLEWVPCK